jgi:hypothetical protein
VVRRKSVCTCCGKEFPYQSRKAKDGSARVQKTCSIACHLATRRDYSGENNPNYRHGHKWKCAHCGKDFVGKRPMNQRHKNKYCSHLCVGLGTVQLARHEGTGHLVLRKRDLNEPEIIAEVKRCGGLWIQGEPLDAWVFHDRTGFVPVEVKSPWRRGRLREFEQSQKLFFAGCDQVGAKYLVWYEPADVRRDLLGVA